MSKIEVYIAEPWRVVQYKDMNSKKKGVEPMREVHEDLVVLEEGCEAGVVQSCCATGTMAKIN